jgi:hypothetical protein
MQELELFPTRIPMQAAVRVIMLIRGGTVNSMGQLVKIFVVVEEIEIAEIVQIVTQSMNV